MKARVVLGLVVAMLSLASFTYAQTSTTIPPKITNVQVQNDSATAITITWNTDKNADALVNYGLQPDYGIVRQPGATTTKHSITIANLLPNEVYHFRVVSADADGNQGISADYKIQTGQTTTETPGNGSNQGNATTSSSTPTSGTPSTQVVVQQIQQIQSQQQLQQIQQAVQQQMQSQSNPLTIVGPPTVDASTTSALVSWTTSNPADSTVQFSPVDNYTAGTYQYSQSATNGDVIYHQVELIGLKPYTLYHFKVISKDATGQSSESSDYTFTTKATLPLIKNLRIVKVEADAATIAWDTTVPATALIEYQDMTTGLKSSVGRPTFATNNELRIGNLTLGTRYVAYVTAENSSGDRVKSQPIQFVTVKDTVPPIVSNVTNESTVFPDDPTRIQTIVEWNTDEPAYCTLSYTEGVNSGNKPSTVNTNGISYSTKHVDVVVDFQPATVYQFWLDCQDQTGNKMQSDKYVLFTPIQQKSIIDLILENFQSTFGWVKNITGGAGSGG